MFCIYDRELQPWESQAAGSGFCIFHECLDHESVTFRPRVRVFFESRKMNTLILPMLVGLFFGPHFPGGGGGGQSWLHAEVLVPILPLVQVNSSKSKGVSGVSPSLF